ncbi:MAG: 6-bladed beta-propeller [Gemmatimonadota bacterium]
MRARSFASLRKTFSTILFVVVTVSGCQSVEAQSSRAVHRERPAAIRLVPVVRLDPNASPFGPTTRILWHRGNYLIVDERKGHEVFVFDAQGEFLTGVGRQGRGPGEFSDIIALGVGAADSVVLFDRGNLRMIVLDPTYRVAREEPLPFVPEKNALLGVAGGAMLVATASGFRTGDVAGVSLIGSRGEVMWTAPDRTYSSGGYVRGVDFAPSTAGHAWVLNNPDYTLRRIDLRTGASIGATLELAGPDWASFTRGGGPPSFGLGVGEDATNRVWTIIRMPQEVSPRPLPPDAPYPTEGPAGIFDLVIEVVDASRGAVIAQSRLDDFPGGLLGRGPVAGSMRVFTYDDEMGAVVVWDAFVN